MSSYFFIQQHSLIQNILTFLFDQIISSIKMSNYLIYGMYCEGIIYCFLLNTFRCAYFIIYNNQVKIQFYKIEEFISKELKL